MFELLFAPGFWLLSRNKVYHRLWYLQVHVYFIIFSYIIVINTWYGPWPSLWLLLGISTTIFFSPSVHVLGLAIASFMTTRFCLDLSPANSPATLETASRHNMSVTYLSSFRDELAPHQQKKRSHFFRVLKRRVSLWRDQKKTATLMFDSRIDTIQRDRYNSNRFPTHIN